jgi:hypothetical protein
MEIRTQPLITISMQQRAGLLFLAKDTGRILLILDEDKWGVPTFIKNKTILEDSLVILKEYSQGRILPIELYLSEDRGFQYETYVCLVDSEFLVRNKLTYCWASLNMLPKQMHVGLKSTLTSETTRIKLETILVIMNDTQTSEQ